MPEQKFINYHVYPPFVISGLAQYTWLNLLGECLELKPSERGDFLKTHKLMWETADF